MEKKRILIAEDEADLIRLYRIILGSRYEIIEAADGEQAVALYFQHRPDLTLMDIKMPVKTGDQAILDILEKDPQARIVAVTAYPYTRDELRVPVLRKGFQPAELLATVQTLISV